MVDSSFVTICHEIGNERERIEIAVAKIMAELPDVFNNSAK
jgi:hypothetical protein